MPILDVEIVGGAPAPAGLATRLADALGAELGAGPGRTWVRLRRLAEADYGESGGGPPEGPGPIFVTLLEADPRTTAVRLRAVAETVGRLCDRPTERVHVLVEPAARGRIAFGGTLPPESAE